MARDTVTVDGVTLTRAQVEKALAKLNSAVPGDVVYRKGTALNGVFFVITKQNDWVGPDGSSSFPGPLDYWSVLASLEEIVSFYREAKGL